jgi:uroporphyrinogen decarboxylase
MTSRERVLGAYEWTGYDRIPVNHEGTPEINSIARARGTDQVLIDLVTDDPVYLEIMEARFKFYYDLHERVLQEAEGLVDITHMADVPGTQKAQVISFETFDKHFAPKLKRYFDMVHRYGARSMMHMCGCVRAFPLRLIDLSVVYC